MRVCQICEKEPATIHLTDIQGNVRTDTHMCGDCAEAKGILAEVAKFEQDVKALAVHNAKARAVVKNLAKRESGD